MISGGSGSSKFISAIESYSPKDQIEPIYIANVGDNFWRFGVYICPDIDIITFTLAGILNSSRGWGVLNDSRNFLSMYSRLRKEPEWFSLGDADLAVSVYRTEMLRAGLTLEETTERISSSLGISRRIAPATNDDVETQILTSEGKMHLQDFWVRLRGEPEATGIEYLGIEAAKPAYSFLSSLSGSVLILPANPLSSIMPTISIPGITDKLRNSKVVAISPFLGGAAFSGPAPKFMRAQGLECSSYGVAKLYSDFLKIFLVDSSEDSSTTNKIKDLGIECIRTNIKIENEFDKEAVVKEILRLI